jgi:isopentenyl diphosphate isomerase/L-lactate dehydrogenase-like FMN-dependent dehydrogenase
MHPALPDPADFTRLLSIDDFEEAARARLSPMAYQYYRGGAGDEETLRQNRAAFARFAIYYRVLVDVAERDLRTTVLGSEVTMPILVAPTAYHRLAHPDGELATARGAAEVGTLFIASTLSTTPLEEVAAASSGPKWFQLYVHKDRGLTRLLVERAVAAGYRALVLTVDAPVLGRRLSDLRQGFALPPGLSLANFRDEASGPPTPGESELARRIAQRHEAALTWRDLEWLRDLSGLPLVVKGLVRPDDALRAVQHGAAGIVVSNHGGRQLDGAPATIDALPAIADAVATVSDRCEIFLDGGVRWGSDVLKALGLGARAVLVGRPTLWGLATAGQAGVARVLSLLRDDLSDVLALAGCPRVTDLPRDLIQATRS